ncbi:MAG: tRNA (adenosine(37)-N6)-threonylcarbamoyltransferase complex transferase subunit TsaD [Hyphomicrobiaceae bacterium]|nr:tRNA (adenosine(37)-N6)-threonylcarbamoyltransferase complex transferase subunit TsaD [Hyphomicrobiaceae bacterium]
MTEQKTLCVLGIETSGDETAASIVLGETDGRAKILSNVVRSQIDEHKAFGGVVPEIAARAHIELLDKLIAQAMNEAGGGEAGLRFRELDGVAVTAGPGLIGGLMVGLMTAKAVCYASDFPLLGINHLEGHALTPGLTDNVLPPYLLLLVSGGHTQVQIVKQVGQYQRLGTTVDDALGEAFDKVAKLMGLDYPGGPQVAKWAQKGNDRRFDFPRPMQGRAEPNFSFSGLKTAVRQQAIKLAPLSDTDIADLCASFERAASEAVVDRVGRAMERYIEVMGADAPLRLVVAGGVAANLRLRGALAALADDRNFTLDVPPVELCTDNAAMIAWAGLEHLLRGASDPLDLPAKARWPLDETAAKIKGVKLC